jgi:hypothetical protein
MAKKYLKSKNEYNVFNSFHIDTNPMPLFQGQAFSEFIEGFEEGRPPTLTESVRIINDQSELIVENLNQMKNTIRERRQSILYLLEQCILISSAIPTEKEKDKARFRRVRRLIEKARRLTRRDTL